MRLHRDEGPYRSVAPAVRADGSYQPVSYWQETIPVTPSPPLAGTFSCDVAIVGAGFTGLSTAIALKEAAPDLDVAVLESGVAGHGASGRNGGFAMPLLGWDLSQTVRSVGADAARDAYRLMYRALDHFKTSIERHQIDCDLECTGYLLLATCRKGAERVRHETETGKRLGFEVDFLDKEALAKHIRSDAFVCGVFDPKPAIVNPAKLAGGLKVAAEAAGVRVYEQTPVTELSAGDNVTIATPDGAVSARHAVLATNGYSGALGFMAARVIPVHTYIVLTEPLTDEQLKATGWDVKRTSLETARKFIHYFRLTADNRILFGGEDVALYYGGRLQDHHDGIYAALERRFRSYFPALHDVAITHRWGGALGVTLDMFPTFGANGPHGNVWHAMGYSGHGVALSNYAGTILAPLILEQGFGRKTDEDAEPPFFMDRRPPWLPPDPLRYVGLQAYRHSLKLHDRVEGA